MSTSLKQHAISVLGGQLETIATVIYDASLPWCADRRIILCRQLLFRQHCYTMFSLLLHLVAVQMAILVAIHVPIEFRLFLLEAELLS